MVELFHVSINCLSVRADQDFISDYQKTIQEENRLRPEDEPAAEQRAILHGNLSAVQKRCERPKLGVNMYFNYTYIRTSEFKSLRR